MCMIIVKEEGRKIPQNFNERLSYCYQKNPHGIGIAFRRKDYNKIFIKKFKKLKHLKKWIKKNVKEEDLLIIHFRFASVGKISTENTQPFPIEKNPTKLSAEEIVCDRCIAHNGTIGNLGNEEYSDTRELAQILSFIPTFQKKEIQKLIKLAVGYSRIVILEKNFPPIYIGNWEEENKIKYSNKKYKKEEKTISIYPHRSYYSDINYDYYLYLRKRCEKCHKVTDNFYYHDKKILCRECWEKEWERSWKK